MKNGYNYLGTLDDSVERFPWSYKITERKLNHSLVVQLITGRPILLNDGYLIHHPLGRAAVMNKDSLLWSLIDAGFVSVLSRGFGSYGLHEMPERMSSTVETFGLLVKNRLPGMPLWHDYREKLEQLDRRLRADGNYISWPSYDAGSGFKVLSERLIERKASVKSLGLSTISSDVALISFLKEYIDLLNKDQSAARTQWEKLAKDFSIRPGNTRSSKRCVLQLMNLANEMYHYNLGIMLSGSMDEPVSVETIVSDAFDDLLLVEDVILDDIPLYPKLNVPRVVTTAPPAKLTQILDEHRPVGKARNRWLDLSLRSQSDEPKDTAELNAAAEEYARRLSEHLGVEISYKESEGLMAFFAGKITADTRSGVVVGAGALIAGAVGPQFGLPPPVAGGAAIAMGFLLSRLQKNMLGTLTKKVRIRVLEYQISSDAKLMKMQRASEKILKGVVNRRVPSAIDMDPIQAKRLLAHYDAFNG